MHYLRSNVWYLVAFAVVLFIVLYLMIKIVDRIRKPRYCVRVKFTSIGAITSTGSPFSIVGR